MAVASRERWHATWNNFAPSFLPLDLFVGEHEDVLDRIQEIADRVPFRPFEEPFILPFGKDYRAPGYANRIRVEEMLKRKG